MTQQYPPPGYPQQGFQQPQQFQQQPAPQQGQQAMWPSHAIPPGQPPVPMTPPPGYQQPQQGFQNGYGAPQGYPQQGGFGAPVGGMPGAVATQVQLPAAPSAPPQFVGVDPALIEAAYAQAREEQAAMQRGDGRMKFVDLAPPDAKDWKGAKVGSKKQFIGWICMPFRPGQTPFALDFTHFWKGAHQPQGDSVPCLGPDCPICIAKDVVLRGSTEQSVVKHAKDVGKVRKQVLYQMLSCQNPQEHVHPDGVMRPLLVRLPHSAHVDIGAKFGLKGVASYLDPQQARPIVITKTKSGAGDMDVDTTIDDLDITPVNPVLWNALQNMHDLTQVQRRAEATLYQTAIMEMGFPMTPDVHNALVRLQQLQAQQPQQPQMMGTAPQPMLPSGQQPSFQPQHAPPGPAPQGWGQNPMAGPPPAGPTVPQQNWAGQPPPGFQNGAPPPPPGGYDPNQMQQNYGYPAPQFQQPQQYPGQQPNVPANVPPHLANQMMGRG